MSNKANNFKIGVFVLTGILSILVIVAVLGAGALFRKTTQAETYFDTSVQGLDEGSPVKYRGVKIGKVDQITIAGEQYPEAERLVLVRFSITIKGVLLKTANGLQESLKQEISKGLRIRLTPQGLTGTSYLEVDYLDARTNPEMKITWEPKTLYIPSAPSVITQFGESLTRIMRSLEDLNFAGLISRLELTLDVLSKSLESAAVDKLSNEAVALLRDLRETNARLQDVIAGADVKAAMKDMRDTASATKRITESSEKPLRDLLTSLSRTSRSIDRMTGKIDAASEDLPEALVQLKIVLKRLDELLAAPQYDIQNTLDNLRSITNNLKDLTEESKKYPSRLLFGAPPTPVNPGGRK